jgi:hypothetical protein
VTALILLLTACHRDPSWESNSYYVASTSRDKIGLLGCHNCGKQGRMTLFFGAPIAVSGGYGTSMWAARAQSTGTIGELVKQFARGYVWCRQDPSYQLFIGIGTSNARIDAHNDLWLAGHGREWASMVASVSAWADRHYPGIVRIYGAWDAEPSWSALSKARHWMNGYQSFPGHRPLYANFSADGCSWTSSDNAPCNNGWTQHHLWDLAWQRPPSLPMPQIYATSGVNAQQWQRISEYGARPHARPLFFYGTMTQSGACAQVGGCDRIDNTRHAARHQLLHHLNQSPLTRQGEIESLTDMRWHS